MCVCVCFCLRVFVCVSGEVGARRCELLPWVSRLGVFVYDCVVKPNTLFATRKLKGHAPSQLPDSDVIWQLQQILYNLVIRDVTLLQSWKKCQQRIPGHTEV